MTLPAKWRRTTAKQRREQREQFKALKQRLEGNPTAETLKRRAKARGDDNRARAQGKLRRVLAGGAISGFSALEVARLRPNEHKMLRHEMVNRLSQLTTDERKAVTANQHLIFATFSVEQLRAVAATPPAQ